MSHESLIETYLDKNNFEFVNLNNIWKDDLVLHLGDKDIEQNLYNIFSPIIDNIKSNNDTHEKQFRRP